MHATKIRTEIIVKGLVQGVGFRYFVLRKAEELGVFGFTKNLYTGEVQIIVEGEKYKIDSFIDAVKIGPIHAQVKSIRVYEKEFRNEFSKFEIRY